MGVLTNAITDSRYAGKICLKHPGLKGLRSKWGGGCIGCGREVAKRNTSIRYYKLKKQGSRYFSVKTCLKHPDLKGERHINGRCIACHRIRVKNNPKHDARKKFDARMRHQKLGKATPPWADRAEISRVYVIAKNRGLSVDHVVPLRGKLVSGLHCPDNFQLLPLILNHSKSNDFEVT